MTFNLSLLEGFDKEIMLPTDFKEARNLFLFTEKSLVNMTRLLRNWHDLLCRSQVSRYSFTKSPR